MQPCNAKLPKRTFKCTASRQGHNVEERQRRRSQTLNLNLYNHGQSFRRERPLVQLETRHYEKCHCPTTLVSANECCCCKGTVGSCKTAVTDVPHYSVWSVQQCDPAGFQVQKQWYVQITGFLTLQLSLKLLPNSLPCFTALQC